jgi:dTDP-4-amino-4,6-dideoxygalactose transaminase
MPDTAANARSVPYVDFPAQYAIEKADIMACVEAVFSKGEFVGSGIIADLEAALADAVGVGHAVALNSGTDALILTMRALDIGSGDEVITPPNSFVASAAAIVATGATPVFADVRADQNIDPTAIEAAITENTRAIMPVHLTGRICDMDAILAIAEKHGIAVIEDAAQSFGSQYRGRSSGSFGVAGCFSAHPLKNLNAAGDAGFVTTNDDKLAARLRLLRNHGLSDRDTVTEWGTVSRLDTLQAAVLLMRLEKVGAVIDARRRNAALYQSLFANSDVFCPLCRAHEFNTFHTFVVQVDRRDELQAFLMEKGIETAVCYPTPLHLQPAAKVLGYKAGDFPVAEEQAGRILSLPVHQFLSEDDTKSVAETILYFHL